MRAFVAVLKTNSKYVCLWAARQVQPLLLAKSVLVFFTLRAQTASSWWRSIISWSQMGIELFFVADRILSNWNKHFWHKCWSRSEYNTKVNNINPFQKIGRQAQKNGLFDLHVANRFPRVANLNMHRRQMHDFDGGLKDKCHLCSYKSLTYCDFIIHINNHTGVRPFKCDTWNGLLSSLG